MARNTSSTSPSAEQSKIRPEIYAISEALGGQVLPNDFMNGAASIKLDHLKQGASIWLHPDWRGSGKWEVSANYPTGPDGKRLIGRDLVAYKEDPADRIGVSITRPIPAIVADIKRRLLPRYFELLDRANKRNKETEEHLSQSNSVAERIAKVLGAEVDGDPKNWERSVNISSLKYDCYGSFRVGSNVEVTLRSLSVETAIKVAELICTLEKTEDK